MTTFVPDDLWRHILVLRTDMMRLERNRRQTARVGHRSFLIQSMSVCRPSDYWMSQHVHVDVRCRDEGERPHELRIDFFHHSRVWGEDRLRSVSAFLKDDAGQVVHSARWEEGESPSLSVSVMGMDLTAAFEAMYDSTPASVLDRILRETHFCSKSVRRGDAFVFDASV